MAVFYTIAKIVHGDFAHKYLFIDHDAKKYYIHDSDYIKIGALGHLLGISLADGALYSFDISDIQSYEEISSASCGGNTAAIYTAGALFGLGGAVAAAVGGRGTLYDVAVFFKNNKLCVFRFENPNAYQSFKTDFYMRDKYTPKSDTSISAPAKQAPNTGSETDLISYSRYKTTVCKTSSKPSPLPSKPLFDINDYITDPDKIIPEAWYDLYFVGYDKSKPWVTDDTLKREYQITWNTERLGYDYFRGELLKSSVSGNKVIAKIQSDNGVVFGAKLRTNCFSKVPQSAKKTQAQPQQPAYIIKPHLIEKNCRYDIYCLKIDTAKSEDARTQLRNLGLSDVALANLEQLHGKLLIEGSAAKKTIRLLNANNGISFGAKVSSHAEEKVLDAHIND